MTAKEYCNTLKNMGLRQVDMAWIMGVTQRQSRRWAKGTSPVPRPAILLLVALHQGRITPQWLRKHIDEPIPYSSLDKD